MKPWLKLAAGERRNENATMVLPMAIDVVAMSPRGDHYLRSMRLTATPPGGEPRLLLNFPDWDMHWRETHVLEQPLRLPAGTRFDLEVNVDNTDDNPRNLNYPAEDIVLGRFTGVDGVLIHAAAVENHEDYRDWVRSLLR